MNWLRKLVCRHDLITVLRYHNTLVPPELWGSELYFDIHDVANLACCFRCKKLLHGAPHEHLFEQEPASE